MKAVKHLWILMLSLITISCGGDVVQTNRNSLLLDDSSTVIRMINSRYPEMCAYSGKAVFRYKDNGKPSAVTLLLDKRCDNSVEAKVLGPFGIVMAELFFMDGDYIVTKGDTRYSGNTSTVGLGDIGHFAMYMSVLPVQLDSSYSMKHVAGDYLFSSVDHEVLVYSDFTIKEIRSTVYGNSYNIGYDWGNGGIVKMDLSVDGGEFSLEFLKPWLKEGV